MTELREIASELKFPEGPVALKDGSILVVEIMAGRLSRIMPDGDKEVIAEPGGGPNGAAIGPDGRCYICNNGGMDAAAASRSMGTTQEAGPLKPSNEIAGPGAGRIEAVDLDTGETAVLYKECDGWPLNAPNDLVFDAQGGFYFTDFGKRQDRMMYRGRVCYALPDGSKIDEVIAPFDTPNGIGLSPDERTIYVAQTDSARLLAFDVLAPGKVNTAPGPTQGGRFLGGVNGMHWFDSLAVDAEGNICVGTLLGEGSITVFTPSGEVLHQISMPDTFPTNICFGGDGLRTAYITFSGSGRLIAMPWPVPGLHLNFL